MADYKGRDFFVLMACIKMCVCVQIIRNERQGVAAENFFLYLHMAL